MLFALLQPSNIVFLVLLAGLLVAFRRRRSGLALLTVGVVLYGVVGFLPVGQLLLRPLETRFPFKGIVEPPDGIIVLGGFIAPLPPYAHNQVNLNDAAERLVAAASLAHRFPDVPVIVTDGGGTRRNRSGAEQAAALLRQMGVPQSQLVLETRSLSTWDNARFSYDVVQPKPGERYVLVTSAWHMPRSVATFHHAGWPELVPWPVDYVEDDRPLWRSLQFSAARGLRQMDEAVREYVALAYYRLTGRIDTWLPGPGA